MNRVSVYYDRYNFYPELIITIDNVEHILSFSSTNTVAGLAGDDSSIGGARYRWDVLLGGVVKFNSSLLIKVRTTYTYSHLEREEALQVYADYALV